MHSSGDMVFPLASWSAGVVIAVESQCLNAEIVHIYIWAGRLNVCRGSHCHLRGPRPLEDVPALQRRMATPLQLPAAGGSVFTHVCVCHAFSHDFKAGHVACLVIGLGTKRVFCAPDDVLDMRPNVLTSKWFWCLPFSRHRYVHTVVRIRRSIIRWDDMYQHSEL